VKAQRTRPVTRHVFGNVLIAGLRTQTSHND
jgi:hypothetical protein